MGNNPHAWPISTKEAAKNRANAMDVIVFIVCFFIFLLFNPATATILQTG